MISLSLHPGYACLDDVKQADEVEMLKVELLKQPLGPGHSPHRTGEFLDAHFETRGAAVEEIQRYINRHQLRGYVEEQDYWWCRNNGDRENVILIISPG